MRKYGSEDDADDAPDARYGIFADVAQLYLDSAEIEMRSRGSYRSALNIYWMPELQHRYVRGIEPPQLRRIDRKIEWPSKKTLRNPLSVLR